MIEGDYEYDQSDGNVRHFRRVKWLDKISRSNIDQDKQTYLQLPKTVFKVQKVVEEHIKTILQERGTLPKDLTIRGINLRSKGQIPEIITEFRNWFNGEAGKKHISTIEKEKQEVKDLMKKLDSMDKSSSEFIDLVLYALLPYAKTKYAMI